MSQRQFKLEKEMTPIVKGWMEGQGLIVKAETGCECGPINVDLMGVEFDEEQVRKRIAIRQRTLLGGKELNAIWWGKLAAREWMPLCKRIVAVELKLTRMKFDSPVPQTPYFSGISKPFLGSVLKS